MSAETPHDSLFKEIFSDPAHARVELCAVLPPAFVAQVDWDTLRVESGSFVEVADRDRFADLLFSVDIDGTASFLYLLFEHQSAPDRLMPLRMLGYMLRKWEQCVREEPALKTLPPIVPVVLHHKPGGWSYPTSFQGLFAEGELARLGIAELIPSFRFVLDDLSEKTDQELLERAVRESERIVPIVLWALRDSRDHERLLASLVVWAGAIAEVYRAPSGRQALLGVFRYIGSTTEFLSSSAILQVVEQTAPEAKEIVMTLAEQWLQQGIEKGRLEGIEKGIEKGRLEGIEKGERAIVARLLALKFGPLTDATRARLDAATPAELELWAERVLTATTLDDVLG